jgi:hypothetical protein
MIDDRRYKMVSSIACPSHANGGGMDGLVGA